MNKRIVPLKNYLILILLFIGLIFITYYLIDWYNETRKYSSNSLVNDFEKSVFAQYPEGSAHKAKI